MLKAFIVMMMVSFLLGCGTFASTKIGQDRARVPKPEIVPHSEWEANPPVGFAAKAVRRNLAPGEKIEFLGLKLTLTELIPLSVDRKKAKDKVTLILEISGKSEQLTQKEGQAFNWNGFHIAIVAAHARDDELGAGLVELEVCTVDSIPEEIARATTAGDASYRARIPHEITMITLHHSGSPKPITDPDEAKTKMHNLQVWGQREKNWWDVPYHFVIGPDGTIFEGRDFHYMGETNTKYDPTGHFLISAMGNYEIQQPTQEQIDSIVSLMAWAADTYDIPVEKIYGHCDLAKTACPGKHLRRLLRNGTLRRAVQSRLGEASGTQAR